MTKNTDQGFKVLNGGMLSLLQDVGRYGYHRMGLAVGGPMDRDAFLWANFLCGNKANSTAIEITLGGLVLEAQLPSTIAVTGADQPLSINGKTYEAWQSHNVKTGDIIELGFSKKALRAYLAVSGGFDIDPVFSSSATVVREGLGGLVGNTGEQGRPLAEGDLLPCSGQQQSRRLIVPVRLRPDYQTEQAFRVIAGYQQKQFHWQQQRLFYSSEYEVSGQSDRMGYRLKGPAVTAQISGVLSEGTCLGAIQFPADGQPIVLMSDRQSIGGYPKIGAMLTLDTYRLAQLMPGLKLSFEAISLPVAQDLLRTHARQMKPESLNACAL